MFQDVFYPFKEEIEEKLSAEVFFFRIFVTKRSKYVLSTIIGQGNY